MNASSESGECATEIILASGRLPAFTTIITISRKKYLCRREFLFYRFRCAYQRVCEDHRAYFQLPDGLRSAYMKPKASGPLIHRNQIPGHFWIRPLAFQI